MAMPSSSATPTSGGGAQARILLDADYVGGVATIFRSDGKYLTLDFPPRPDSPIARSLHVVGVPYVVATTDRGEDVTVELPTLGNLAPLRGRPVVYLDQQAWSKLALAQHEPKVLPPKELDAALWLVDLVKEWAVVLPYSNGVLTETSHWTNREKRRRLALTIATLSRGWQMLDPLALRSAEMRSVVGADPDRWPLPTVWTLEPGAASAARGDRVDVGDGLPPELALTTNAASSTIAVFATILDKDPIERADPNGWANRWAALADHVRETSKPAHLTAKAVHAAVIGDATQEFARAAASVGCTPEVFSTWLNEAARDDLRGLPALGLVREVTYLKVVNSTARWEPNDLHDIFYLVHAAGYADAVVGERGFITLIEQAQRRLGRPVTAYKTLHLLRASGLLDGVEGAGPDKGTETPPDSSR